MKVLVLKQQKKMNKEKITFEELPQAVSYLIEKVGVIDKNDAQNC